MNAGYHGRKADVCLSAGSLPELHLLVAQEPCVGSCGFPARCSSSPRNPVFLRYLHFPSALFSVAFGVYRGPSAMPDGQWRVTKLWVFCTNGPSDKPRAGLPWEVAACVVRAQPQSGGRRQPQPEEPPCSARSLQRRPHGSLLSPLTGSFSH